MKDLLCHDLAAGTNDIDNVGFLQIPNMSQTDVADEAGGRPARREPGHGVRRLLRRPGAAARSARSCRQFKLGASSIDPATDYVAAERQPDHHYMLLFATGTTPGVGSQVDAVPRAVDDVDRHDRQRGRRLRRQRPRSSRRRWASHADLRRRTAPSGTSTGASSPRTASASRCCSPRSTSVLIGFYQGKTAADLQTSFKDIEHDRDHAVRGRRSRSARATSTWATPRCRAGPRRSRASAQTDGVWALAVTCSKCQVPAPVADVHSPAPVAQNDVRLSVALTTLAARGGRRGHGRRRRRLLRRRAGRARGRARGRVHRARRRSDGGALQPGRPRHHRRHDDHGGQPVLVQRLLVHARADAGLGHTPTRRRAADGDVRQGPNDNAVAGRRAAARRWRRTWACATSASRWPRSRPGPSRVSSRARPRHSRAGGQRYMMLSREAIILNYTASAAWKFRDLFGVGVTLQWIAVPRLDYSLMIDGTRVASRPPTRCRARSTWWRRRRGSDPFTFNAIVGAWFRPVPSLQFGAAGQVVPSEHRRPTARSVTVTPLDPTMRTVALTRNGLPANDVSVDAAAAADGARGRALPGPGGGRARCFDIELDVEYETWSRVNDFTVEHATGCVANLSGLGRRPRATSRSPRRGATRLAVKLGGDVAVIPGRLALRAGAFYETARRGPRPTPTSTSPAARCSAAPSARSLAFGRWEVAIAYQLRHQATVTVSEPNAQRLPAGAGQRLHAALHRAHGCNPTLPRASRRRR